MTNQQTVSIQVTHTFNASPERVFDAWLDPDKARGWLFTTPNGEMIKVEIDPQVGGRFTIVRRDGEDVEHVGEYLEIDRPRRLVFTFAVPKYSELYTTVAIDIEPLPTGCKLTLTHDGVLAEWAKPSEAGWGMILEGLEKSL
jgi:uncharacterized protein YndB with AHSA1/START domain